MLACRNRIAVWSVNDDNPACRCGLQIDVVDPDTSAADDFQAGPGFHDFFGYFRLATDQKTVILRNDLHQFVFAETWFFVDLNVGCIHQLLDSQIADRIRY
ncbi:hypothetical protein D3C81_645580 [compost metagenome]